MTPTIRRRYHRFRSAGYLPPQAIRAARIVAKFQALESAGAARIMARPDPDCDHDGEAWGTIGQVRADIGEWLDGPVTIRAVPGRWREVDSVWGHVGYSNPTDPTENPYVVDHMHACVAAFKTAWHDHLEAARAARHWAKV